MAGVQRLNIEESDLVLVRRFAREQDGQAFAVLVGRYADMVYTTCHRILGDDSQAADAVQETFFQMVKNAGRITGSLAAWLHRVATRRAIDIVRQNAARRKREQTFACDSHPGAGTWSEVEPAVDEALEQLPDHLRGLLVLHFLQGRSTIQIAALQGVSQPTISRRISEALECLRQALRDRGVQAGVVPLQTVLLHTNYFAPPTLKAGLGKIALAKAVAGSAAWISGSSAPLSGIPAKLVLVAVLVGLPLGTIWLLRHQIAKPSPASSSLAPSSAQAASAPQPLALGGASAGIEQRVTAVAQAAQTIAQATPQPHLKRIGPQRATSRPPPFPVMNDPAPVTVEVISPPETVAYPRQMAAPGGLPAQNSAALPMNPFLITPPQGNSRANAYGLPSIQMFSNPQNDQTGKTNSSLNQVIVLGPAPTYYSAPAVRVTRYPAQPLAPRGPGPQRQPNQIKGF